MQRSTADKLRAIAPLILRGEFTERSPYCPEVARRAIAILQILQDGEWHSSTVIASELGISPQYVRGILDAVKDCWGLARHRRYGYMLVKPGSAIVV